MGSYGEIMEDNFNGFVPGEMLPGLFWFDHQLIERFIEINLNISHQLPGLGSMLVV